MLDFKKIVNVFAIAMIFTSMSANAAEQVCKRVCSVTVVTVGLLPVTISKCEWTCEDVTPKPPVQQ